MQQQSRYSYLYEDFVLFDVFNLTHCFFFQRCPRLQELTCGIVTLESFPPLPSFVHLSLRITAEAVERNAQATVDRLLATCTALRTVSHCSSYFEGTYYNTAASGMLAELSIVFLCTRLTRTACTREVQNRINPFFFFHSFFAYLDI